MNYRTDPKTSILVVILTLLILSSIGVTALGYIQTEDVTVEVLNKHWHLDEDADGDRQVIRVIEVVHKGTGIEEDFLLQQDPLRGQLLVGRLYSRMRENKLYHCTAVGLKHFFLRRNLVNCYQVLPSSR